MESLHQLTMYVSFRVKLNCERQFTFNFQLTTTDPSQAMFKYNLKAVSQNICCINYGNYLQCACPESIHMHTPPIEGVGISWEWEVLWDPNFKEMCKALLEIAEVWGGGGCLTKNPFCGRGMERYGYFLELCNFCICSRSKWLSG